MQLKLSRRSLGNAYTLSVDCYCYNSFSIFLLQYGPIFSIVVLSVLKIISFLASLLFRCLHCLDLPYAAQVHGLSSLQSPQQEDHMPSYFLAETCKYAFLIANSSFLAVRALPQHRLKIPFCLHALICIALSSNDAGQPMSHRLVSASSV